MKTNDENTKARTTRGRETDLEKQDSPKKMEFWDEMASHQKQVGKVTLIKNDPQYQKIQKHNQKRRDALSFWEKKRTERRKLIYALALLFPLWLVAILIAFLWLIW